MSRRARFKRRPTKAEVQALLDRANGLNWSIYRLLDYERNARDSEWADMDDHFSPMAHAALDHVRGLVHFLTEAVREAR